MFLMGALIELDQHIAAQEEIEMQRIRDAMTTWAMSYDDGQAAIENIRSRTETRFNAILDEQQMRSYLLFKNST
jgi:hypothetical protein